MKLAIIKYNAGNIQSVLFALERIGINAIVTDHHAEIQSADKVIFPGVGEASSAMRYLREKNLDTLITQLKQPFLGICLGMQLMCSYSEENDTTCLGIFSEKVRLFPSNPVHKVPHIGWNSIYNLKTNLFNHIPEKSFTYFVHSYFVEMSSHSIAQTDYILPFCAGIQKDNFYAVQFHPEKSEKIGARLIQNFIELV